MVKPLVVLDLAGLTTRLLTHMPGLTAMGARGWRATISTVLPAVARTTQATYLTGALPSSHGVVGDGWYFRDLGEVSFRRAHLGLAAGEKLWEAARRLHPGHTTARAGDPGAAQRILDRERPDLLLVALPRLADDLQRFGPRSPRAAAAATAVDTAVAGLVARSGSGEIDVVVLGGYGISPVRRPVGINRLLRAEGFLRVSSQAGMEHLDAPASRAFAVADHQIAHVYVPDPADHAKVRSMLEALDGVDEVLDRAAQERYGLDHHRGGEFVAVAEPDAWFTYYYWLDDTRAPGFARGVETHRKPGYDPADLLVDPAAPEIGGKAPLILAKPRAGLRWAMNVVPLDPALVRGSHGRPPESPADEPVGLCSSPRVPRAAAGGRLAATDVRQALLDVQGLPVYPHG